MDAYIPDNPVILLPTRQTVSFLSVISLQISQSPHKRPQMLQIGVEWLPQGWFLLQTKLGNQVSICLVRLVAVQFAFPIAFDACRIDHTDVMPSFVKILADLVPILSGGFQANVYPVDMSADQPLIQLLETRQIVPDYLMVLAFFTQ